MKRMAAIGAMVLAVCAGVAEAEGVAVAGRVSTMGFGAEGIVGLGSRVNARVGLNRASLSHSREYEDIDYDVDLDLETYTMLLDWHVGGGGFRVTGGAVWNRNEFRGTARPASDEEIGGNTYTPEEIGTLRAKLTFPDWAGYVGIGFGNALQSGDGRWSALFDIGCFFHSTPDFTLKADGGLAADPQFEDDIERERQDIESDVTDKIRFYPVLSIGLAYRF